MLSPLNQTQEFLQASSKLGMLFISFFGLHDSRALQQNIAHNALICIIQLPVWCDYLIILPNKKQAVCTNLHYKAICIKWGHLY